MQVAVKIWRVDPQSGERALREYEVDAPEWVTLLDVLDIVKDRHDGTLAFRKSCRMMICGSCGMRMDGAAVLACKTRMFDMAQAGHVPVVSAMGNLPIVKDLVVDMEPFWAKYRAVDPFLRPGYGEAPGGREHLISQERMNVIHKESLCINCGACVSECNAMESDPDFLGPQALAKAMRFAGDPRDAIAKLGAESVKEGIDRDMGAKHAKWFVHSARTTGWLRETELVPKTQGIVESIKQARFALRLARVGKVPTPFPPHVAKNVKEARALHDLLAEQNRAGYAGIVQGEPALAKLAHGHREGERDPYGEGSFPRPKPLASEEPQQ